MHICLNMLNGWTGGTIYTHNLARAIASLPSKDRNQIKLSIAINPSDLKLVKPVSYCIDQVHVRTFWERTSRKLSLLLAEKASFIPANLLNPRQFDFVYPEITGVRYPCHWGGWIPDFQHYHLPYLFSQEEIDSRNRVFQRIADAAPIIVLSSQMAQKDFSNLYPEAASRSTVMHFATCPKPEWFQLDPKVTQEQYGLSDRFFLVSNQFWKHKDHAVVIESLSLLKQEGIKPTVVCTGNPEDPRNPGYYNQLLARIEELEVGDQFKILGLIPRIDQIQLMRRCLAVIQPSLFEGWSTVVEDARTIGKPMLISDFPVHIEQNPPNSHFFERSNAEQLATLMSTALSNLKPGPDLEKESVAQQKNLERMMTFGSCFLEIVNNVVKK